jgi:hypothetical protein
MNCTELLTCRQRPVSGTAVRCVRGASSVGPRCTNSSRLLSAACSHQGLASLDNLRRTTLVDGLGLPHRSLEAS